MSDAAATVHLLVRVWLPDRPGALGLVASRIGSVGGDIVGVDVLERGIGVAIDEFAVQLPTPELVDLMVREIEQVDGASIEEVRRVDRFPDPRLDALESVEVLCGAESVAELSHMLVAHTRQEFLADWAALVTREHLVAAAGPDVPSAATLAALAAGTAASPMVAAGSAGPDDLAVARLTDSRATLLLGRSGHPFRLRERLQLLAIARVADRMWQLLATHSAAGSSVR